MIGGRYTLLREIGRGGMGAVWLGRDEVLGREVAIKRIGLMPGGATPDLARAAREARLAAQVNHPHIVSVFDLIQDGDEQWLVMEHVAGADLGTYVKRQGPLTPDQAGGIVARAAEALAAAHAVGIVHRDVKPSNILIADDGQVKLTDFGIARAEQDAQLTATGLVTGSPAYLAPEIASGRLATTAADVWSLGATLFHALEGRPPYEVQGNLVGTLYQIVHEDPPRPTSPGWLAPLIAATLTKEPSERWTMQEVHDFATSGGRSPVATTQPAAEISTGPSETRVMPAVSPERPTDAVTATAPSARERADVATPRSRARWLAGALAVIAVIALGAWWLARDKNESPQASDPKTTSTASQATSPTPTVDEEAARKAQEQAMKLFVTDYLALVVDNPNQSWKLLTPGFQDASGGKKTYREFWKDFETASVSNIRPNVAAGTVTYDVTYTKKDGGGFTDTPTLTLQQQGDSYLIAAER